jgi:hypothetical protein
VSYTPLLGVLITDLLSQNATVNASNFCLETEYYKLEFPTLQRVHEKRLAFSGVYKFFSGCDSQRKFQVFQPRHLLDVRQYEIPLLDSN